jgi:hypothetical protein
LRHTGRKGAGTNNNNCFIHRNLLLRFH